MCVKYFFMKASRSTKKHFFFQILDQKQSSIVRGKVKLFSRMRLVLSINTENEER